MASKPMTSHCVEGTLLVALAKKGTSVESLALFWYQVWHAEAQCMAEKATRQTRQENPVYH